MRGLFAFALIVCIESQAIDNCIAASICNDTIQCSSMGICYVNITEYFQVNYTKSVTCICNIGWTDDPVNNSVKCCYKRKSQALAFILESVVGLGIGHLYIGNPLIGYFKFSFSLVLCCFFWSNIFISFYREAKIENINRGHRKREGSVLIIVGCFCTYFIWQLVDMILFGINYYCDGNGIALDQW